MESSQLEMVCWISLVGPRGPDFEFGRSVSETSAGGRCRHEKAASPSPNTGKQDRGDGEGQWGGYLFSARSSSIF